MSRDSAASALILANFVAADGIALGHHLDKCCITVPYAGAGIDYWFFSECARGCTAFVPLLVMRLHSLAPSATVARCTAQRWTLPLQYGSAFADRLFVRSPRARELLRRFSSCSSTDNGLTEAELQELQQFFEDSSSPAHSLLPFLDHLLAAEAHRQLLKCLACPASADAVLPTAAHAAAQDMVDTKQLTLAS
jgi:hypothetical protein